MSVYSALTCVLIALLPQDVAKTAIQDELLLTAQTHFGVVDRVEPHELNQPLVTLGHKLFWDARISANKQVACVSCHSAAAGGADAVPQSIDAKGQPTKRNSQTVFNAMLQPSLRWTGDRNSGAHQAEKSLTGSMGFAKAEDVNNVLQEHGYGPLFQTAFPADPNPIRPGNYATAVEAYEATLRTPAPFDKFLLGEVRSLSKRQQKGLQLFIEIGCANCHSGKLLGGDGFERFGIHREYWTETQSRQQDVGLFETTKNEVDKFRFRVAMLRNIEKTAPYFHDGSVATLSEAVRIMANLQLDRQLSPTEIEAIVDFLSSLTGEIPANYSAPAFPDMEFSEMSKPKSEWKIEQ
ncbi:MAG: c-type cytochrome [Planctomycetaceae bacterium]|nr:c-type cytochrome [Planctomycetaceae bacterium]